VVLFILLLLKFSFMCSNSFRVFFDVQIRRVRCLARAGRCSVTNGDFRPPYPYQRAFG